MKLEFKKKTDKRTKLPKVYKDKKIRFGKKTEINNNSLIDLILFLRAVDCIQKHFFTVYFFL